MRAERILWRNKTSRNAFLNGLRTPSCELNDNIDSLGLNQRRNRLVKFLVRTRLINSRILRKFSFFSSANKLLLHTSHIGLISLEETSSVNYLEAGRVIQRMWLMLTKLNIDIQPMCDIIDLIMLYKYKESSFLSFHGARSFDVSRTLKDITEQFNKLFGLGFGKTSLFMFRMGKRSNDPMKVSKRKNLSHFLENNCREILGYDQTGRD
jgi:hypothetical protein